MIYQTKVKTSRGIFRGGYYVLGKLKVLNFFEIFEIKVLNLLPHFFH